LSNSIFGCLVEEGDGSKDFYSSHPAVFISNSFNDDNAFDSGLTCDFWVNGVYAGEKLWGFDTSDSSYWSLYFTYDTTEYASYNTAENPSYNAAFDSAFDSTLDPDIYEFFFCDLIGDIDGSD
jgi:hypothetical protein